LSLTDDHFAPVVGEWSVEGERRALDAGNAFEALLEGAVGGVELLGGVAGEWRIEAEVDAMVGLEAEVLMLHVEEAAGEQACSCEKDNGQGGLHDDERFLGEGRTVAGGAIGAAKSFGRFGVGGE